MAAQPAAERESSDFELASELDDEVMRELEELHRALGVAKHPGEQLLAPHGHSRPRRGNQSLAGEEEAGVHHLADRPAILGLGEGGGNVDFLHEAVAQLKPIEARAVIVSLEAGVLG